MKRIFAFILSLCTLVSIAQSRSYEDKLQSMQEYPRTVIKEARVAFDEAARRHKSPEMLDALMLLSSTRMRLDSDSIAMIVRDVEEIMNKCYNKVDRSVIALYLIDVYNAYLSNFHYRFASRAYVKGNKDISTWSVHNVYDVIDSLQRVALQPTSALQKTPISRYSDIIGVEGYEGDDMFGWVEKFYPTMYDFVASMVYEMNIDHRAPKIQLGDVVESVLADVIQYHEKHRKGAPLMMWRMKGLYYTYLMTRNTNAYIQAMDELIAQNARHDYVIEAIIARYAHTMHETSFEIENEYNSLRQWVDRYPHYYRVGSLQLLCAELSAASISLEMPHVLCLGDSIVANISYSNVDSMECVLYKSELSQPIKSIPHRSDETLEWEEYMSQKIVGKGIDFKKHISRLVYAPQSAGLYRLVITSHGERDEVTFVVTPYMLLTIGASPSETLALLLDIKTGEPVAGEKIILKSRSGDVLQELSTDIDGVCRCEKPGNEAAYYIHLADVSLYPFMQTLSFATAYIESTNIEARLFTDRAIYRPGQKLYFSGIVYRIDEAMRHVVANRSAQVKLVDNGNNVLWTGDCVTDAYGSFSGEIELPTSASLGEWRLSVSGDGFYATQYIDVTEYKRPQFAVECNPVEGIYSYGDSVQVNGVAVTYSGAEVSFAQVAYAVRRSTFMYGGSDLILQGHTSTDADGCFSFSFVTAEPQDEYARMWGARYIAEVTVTSPTGESRQDVMMVYVSGDGIKFRYNIPNEVCREDVQGFDIAVINGSGVVQELPFNLALYRIDTGTVDNKTDIRIDNVLWRGDYTGSVQDVVLPLQSFSSGKYRLIMTGLMASGQQYTDSVDFICYSDTDKYPPVPVELWTPQKNYEAHMGDIVTIAVGSALRDASLYYFISNDKGRIEAHRIEIDNNMTLIDVPFDSLCTDAIQVMFLVARNKQIYRKRIMITRKQPDVQLTITPVTFRDKTVPGNSEKWQFTVRDAEGKPVDALFMANMYDASLDALRAHAWHFNPRYSPHSKYYLSIDYPWFLNNVDYTYLYYRNEFPTAQYVGGVLPLLHNYLMSHYGKINGGVLYRSVPPSAVATVLSKSEMSNDMAVSEESVAETEGMSATSDVISETGNTSLKQVEYRDDMDETAFFYPHLITDKSGNVKMEFTMPESNTTWNFLSLAVTPQLYNGMYTASVVSSKPLMVQPNMPRFVRQGDKMVLSAAVYNMTDTIMQGDVQCVIYNPANDSVIGVESLSFVAEARTSVTVQFTVSIPDTLSLMGVRIGAMTDLYSDGEQHLLAVLPSTTVVTESEPFYLNPSVSDTTIVFDAMREKIEHNEVQNIRVTLEYCDNPIWYAVTALPSLAQPEDKSIISLMASLYANVVSTGIVEQNRPVAQALAAWSKDVNTPALVSQLEQNEELKQLLLSTTPWLMEATTSTEQLRQIATLLDVKSAQKMVQEAVKQLREWQQSDGGWPWFNGMQSSFTITLNVTEGLSRMMQWGDIGNIEPMAMMRMDALRYLDTEYLRRNKELPEMPDYLDLCYLYVRSSLLDVPMTSELRAMCNQQLDTVASHWYQLDEVEKAYAAIALYRSGNKRVAENIINSLREYAVISSVQGMYWPENRSNSFYRNSAVQVHCAIYEAFALVSPRTTELDAMRQWLLLQKQTQDWEGVPSTLDAVNILLSSGTNWIVDSNPMQIEWGNAPLPDTSQAEQIMGYTKYVREGKAINSTDATLCIKGHEEKPSWGALYWQYSDEIVDVEAHGTADINVERNYYVVRDGDLVPIENRSIAVGDVVTVRITVRTTRDMQYMALTDARPACFEPQEQLPQYNISQGLWYYSVPQDAVTTFYIEHLPRGVYVIEYNVYADRQGVFQAGVATLQSYYAPQFTAHTSGATIAITK